MDEKSDGGEIVCKILVECDAQDMLKLATELEARNDIKGVYFKYNSTTKKLFK